MGCDNFGTSSGPVLIFSNPYTDRWIVIRRFDSILELACKKEGQKWVLPCDLAENATVSICTSSISISSIINWYNKLFYSKNEKNFAVVVRFLNTILERKIYKRHILGIYLAYHTTHFAKPRVRISRCF